MTDTDKKIYIELDKENGGLYTRFIRHINRTGGWRARSDLESLVELARCSFSAAENCRDTKKYKTMMIELDEGIKAAMKLKKLIEDSSKPV